jgi:hypothetical protein
MKTEILRQLSQSELRRLIIAAVGEMMAKLEKTEKRLLDADPKSLSATVVNNWDRIAREWPQTLPQMLRMLDPSKQSEAMKESLRLLHVTRASPKKAK